MKNEILAFNIFCCLQIVPVRWTVSKECCMFLQGLLSKQHWICLACSFGIVILTIYSGKHRTELVALLGRRLQGKKLPLEKGSPAGVLLMMSYTGRLRPF